MWILTRELNEYNQDGEYFEAAWANKPTLDQLLDMERLAHEDLNHILNGGGRKEYENEWFNLYEYNEK